MNQYIQSVMLFVLAAECGYFIKQTDPWSTNSGLAMHHALCVALCVAVVVGLRTAIWPASPIFAICAFGLGAAILAIISGRFDTKNGSRTKLIALVLAISNGLGALIVARRLP